ncbi:MAG: hypothetical protein ACLR5H_05550 [Oscillospiraceae bacterium]
MVFITVVPTFLPQEELARELVKMTETTPQAQEKPVFYCVMAGAYTSPARRIMAAGGPVYLRRPGQGRPGSEEYVQLRRLSSAAEGGLSHV